MRNLSFKYLWGISVLFLICSCAEVRNISLGKAQYLNIDKNYEVFLNDSIKIDFEYTFLDKQNITEILSNKGLKKINVYQKNSNPKQFFFSDLLAGNDNSGKIEWKNNYEMIILNGVNVDSANFDKYYIEVDAIKEFIVLKSDSMNNNLNLCRGFKNDILLISTK